MPNRTPNDSTPEIAIDSTSATRYSTDDRERTTKEEGDGRLPIRTRIFLLIMGTAFIAVYTIATYVQPYDADGNALRYGSHRTIGMPACNFQSWFGLPCPSCGMTTSFALLVRGDLYNSLRANWVGTMMALVWATLIPWSIWSSLRGRYVWVKNVEVPVGILVGGFTILMMIRWGIVLLLIMLFD